MATAVLVGSCVLYSDLLHPGFELRATELQLWLGVCHVEVGERPCCIKGLRNVEKMSSESSQTHFYTHFSNSKSTISNGHSNNPSTSLALE